MKNKNKTKKELSDELQQLKQKISKFEKLTVRHEQTEKLLIESEERFRTVADFTYDWEYWVDPDRNYVYISPSCKRVTGYSPDEFLKDPGLMERIIHPGDRKVVSRHLQEELKPGKMFSIDFRIISRDKEERWISHVCQPVYSIEGNFLGRRVSNRDITERVCAEEKLRKYQKNLEDIVEELRKYRENLENIV